MTTAAFVFGAISILIAIVNFILSILDRGKKNQKENHQELIEYQLKELKEDIQKIISKLDKYDKEFDDRIEKRIILHEEIYHKGDAR